MNTKAIEAALEKVAGLPRYFPKPGAGASFAPGDYMYRDDSGTLLSRQDVLVVVQEAFDALRSVPESRPEGVREAMAAVDEDPKMDGSLWREASRTLASEVSRLTGVLEEAAGDIEEWGGYASEYFQQKHDLAGTIAKYRLPPNHKKESDQ